MSKHVFRELELADTLIAAIQKRETGGNVIKALAEVIKNSDDAYHRLQKKNVETAGVIEVGYWPAWSDSKKKRHVIERFYVRDHGNGMSLEQATAAYGGGIKSYGANTSGGVRNGAIGVGGKDALVGMLDIFIVTVQDGKPTVIEARTNPNGRLATTIYDNISDVKYAIDELNKRLSPRCDPISSNMDGTFVLFTLPEFMQVLKFNAVRRGLERFFTLRNITQGKNKTVLKMIDVLTGETTRLKYEEPDADILQKPVPIHIPHVNQRGIQDHYQVDVLIKRAHDRLDDKTRETGDNFIVETDQGGIPDNHNFGMGKEDPAAAKIFGKIIIHNWNALFDDDKGVLPESREGLSWSHKFNKELESRVMQYLRPLLDTERKKLPPNAEADKQLNKKIKSTLNFLNKLIQEEEYETEDEGRQPPDIMAFSYGRMKIVPGKTKTLKLFVNPYAVPELTEISTMITEGQKACVSVEPYGTVKTPEQYLFPPLVPFIQFQVTADMEGDDSHLKAYFQNHEAEVVLSVVTENELYPKNGFAFVPESVRFVKGKGKRLRLVIDTHLFEPSTIIELEPEDERITLPFSKITVSEPNMGKYLTEEFVDIGCEESQIKSRILAKAKTVTGEDRVAVCKVRVIEKEEPKVFFKDVKIDPAGEPRARGRFEDGIIWIHGHNPVLELYFGQNQENITPPGKPTKEAVALLADTVCFIALRQWAKKRVEDGSVVIIEESQKDEEIEAERGNLERKYGKQIHQTIKGKWLGK